MKFLLLLCALVAAVCCDPSPAKMYYDNLCIGIAQQVQPKIEIRYTICCDGGFGRSLLWDGFPDNVNTISMSSVDCKKVRDIEFNRLPAEKKNCQKQLYYVDL